MPIIYFQNLEVVEARTPVKIKENIGSIVKEEEKIEIGKYYPKKTIKFNYLGSKENKEITAYFKENKSPPLIRLKALLKNSGVDEYEIDGERLRFQLNGKTIEVILDIINSAEGLSIKEIFKNENLLLSVQEIEKIFKGKQVIWDPQKLTLTVKNKTKPPIISEYDEGIITMSANKVIVDEEILSYFKGDNLSPLISLDDFLNNIGINKYEIEENQLNFQLNGNPVSKEIKIIQKYDENLTEITEIGKIFEDAEIEWDPSELNLDLQTKGMLPIEYFNSQKNKRNRLNNKEEEDVIEEQWKLFTPGLLRMGYSRSDIEKNNDYLYMNYTNHTLYGNLNVNGSYTSNSYENEFKIDNIKWERNVLDGRILSLGDGYVSTPFNIGQTGSFIGASIFSKNSWDRSLDVGSKSVRGYAPTGTTVELYENGIIKEFVVVSGSEYVFDIETTGGSRNYEVWIYNEDGTIDKKKIALYGSNDLVKVGEFDYEVQVGQEKENYESMYNAKISYGVTEDLTLGLGAYNSQGREYFGDKKKNEYLNLSFLQRISTGEKWSNIIGGDYSFNPSENGENFYKAEFTNGNGEISNTFGVSNYRELDDLFLTENYDEKFYGRSNFSIFNSNMSLSYENEKLDKENRELNRYGVTIYGTAFRGRVSSSLNYSFEDVKRNGERDSNNRLGLSLSYNIYGEKYSKYINSIVLDYDTTDFRDENYGIRFYKSKGSKEAFDYSLGFRRQRDDNVVELAVSYTFDKAFELTGNVKDTPRGTTTGVGAKTTVNFGSDKKFVHSNFGGDSNLEGIVFIDKEATGTYDVGDTVVKDIKVINSAGEGKSDINGRYEIPLLSSKIKHPLRIYNENEDLMMGYRIPEKYFVKTLPGGDLKLNIPITQVKTLVGIFEFTNDFYLEEVDDFLKNVKINMKNVKTKENKVLDIQGETIISEIPQGTYLMEINYEGQNNYSVEEEKFLVNISSGEDIEEYLDFNISKVGEKVVLKLVLNEKEIYALGKKEKKELLTLYGVK